MPSLSEIVDVVIGVDTHVETHTAAVVDARTGAVLDEMTNLDVAPTMAKLLGLEMKNVDGRVLGEILVK